jgi:hypothetical protein
MAGHAITVSGGQDTKTRRALQVFSKRLQAEQATASPA